MEKAFRKAIELSPNYATAYHWYSVSLVDDPVRSREPLDLLLKAAELDPRSMIIGASVASKYFQQGLFSRGEQQALKIIELYPDFPNGHDMLVDFHIWQTGEFAKALEQVRALSRIDPDDFDALRHQIEIYVLVGDYSAAAELQEQIADMDPEIWWAGWADFPRAMTKGSGPAMREAGNWMLQRAGNRPRLTSVVAQSMLISGDLDRARAFYRQLYPDTPDVGNGKSAGTRKRPVPFPGCC